MSNLSKTFDSQLQRTESGCHIWKGYSVKSNGLESHRYGRLGVNGKKVLAHRFAWEQYRGPIPEGMCVLHRCDVTLCCNPEHLFLGTHADNMADMKNKGRARQTFPRLYGESNPRCKLSDQQVLEIISRRRLGETVTNLAKYFGVHHAHISRICNNTRRNAP